MEQPSYPIFERMQRQLRGEDVGQFEHHEDFRKMIADFNAYFASNINRVENLFEYDIKRDANLMENVQGFTVFLAEQVFGREYAQTVNDYVVLRNNMSSGNYSEQWLRGYYFKILAHQLRINYKDGTTNLKALEPELIRLADYAFLHFVQSRNYRVSLIFHGDETRLLRAMLFFVLITMIMHIALPLIKEKAGKNYQDYVKIITKIYYGISLSEEQFRILQEKNLLGGIVFRGLRAYNVGMLLGILSFKQPGTSWTANYWVAVKFAAGAQVDTRMVLKAPANYLITSVEQFRKELHILLKYGGSLNIFVDDPNVAKGIAQVLLSISRTRGVHLEVGAAVILSYPIFREKNLFYLGGPASKSSSPVSQEKEVIINPRFFRPSKVSVDVAMQIIVRK